VQALLLYLRSESVTSPESDCSQPEPQLLEQFRRWMLQHRGVVASTMDAYGRIIRALLECLGNQPARWNAQGVRGFVLQRGARGASETVVTATRVFLRYMAVAGQVTPGLDHAVPSIASWRLSALPRYIPASEVSRVVASCNVNTSVGARDRAIILLLSRLALRAGDIAALRFNDMDWKDGTLRVAGKGRREVRLPMPQEVGDAILVYLERGRAAFDDDHVFLALAAPLRSLRPQAVSSLVARAIHRAGVKAPSRGAHVLRHSAATNMLRQGSSLDAIATLLRHRSIETTAHYAKVDLGLLREILQPWPVEAPC
jgi:site-specific recombinase XerD